MRAKISFSLALCLSVLAFGQEGRPPQGPGVDLPRNRGEFRDLIRVVGTVVSIDGEQIVVKPESGEDVTVKVGADARIRKDRQEAKLPDFKPGDRIMVAGTEETDKVLNARFVAGGEVGQMMMRRPSPEEMVKMGLGTTFIAGEVKSIEETKLTILRPDGQTQTIEVDENTSFRDGKNESVTLADVKVGDRVMGRGELKNGVFVPQTLRVGMPEGPGGFGGGRREPGGSGQMPPQPPQPEQQQPK